MSSTWVARLICLRAIIRGYKDDDPLSGLKSTSDKKTTFKKPISRRPAILKYCIGYFWKQMFMNFYFEFKDWYTQSIKNHNVQTDFHF